MEMNEDLLISYLLKEVSSEQRRQVENWLKANPANQQRLEQYRSIWDTSRHISGDTDINARASLEHFRQKYGERSPIGRKVIAINRPYMLLKIVATLLLLGGGAWLLWSSGNDNKMITSVAHTKGQSDTLSDGSVITLNQSAVLHYPSEFQEQLREVSLVKGEAFFDIMHDRKQPFILHAGSTDIQVLGTSFNVKRKDKRVEVIVETGLVSVTAAGRTIFVKPGEKVVVSGSGTSPLRTVHAGKLYQYYRTKEFVAEDTPLSALVAVLNDAYGSHIVIANPKLGNLPLNTAFKDESLDDILDIISRTFKIKVVRTPNAIILK